MKEENVSTLAHKWPGHQDRPNDITTVIS